MVRRFDSSASEQAHVGRHHSGNAPGESTLGLCEAEPLDSGGPRRSTEFETTHLRDQHPAGRTTWTEQREPGETRADDQPILPPSGWT